MVSRKPNATLNENGEKKKRGINWTKDMLHAGLITATISHRDSSCRSDQLRRCFRRVADLPKAPLRPERETSRATGSAKNATTMEVRLWAPEVGDRTVQPDGGGGDDAETNCNDD